MSDKQVLYIAIDVENNSNAPKPHWKGTPFWPGNRLVTVQIDDGNEISHCDYFDRDGTVDSYLGKTAVLKYLSSKILDEGQPVMFIGHNIKHDMHVLFQHDSRWRELFDRADIWDTQLAEYIITGQETMMSSLNQLVSKYCLSHPLKNDKIKEYWQQGLDTDQIPKDELVEYALNDARMTSIVFKAQLEELEMQIEMLKEKRGNLLELLMLEMEALRATQEMEFNGIVIDRDLLGQGKRELEDRKTVIENNLKLLCTGAFDDGFDLNYNSPKELSVYLFGGKLKRDIAVTVTNPETGEPVVYKTGKRAGQVKTKKAKHTVEVKGQLDPTNYGAEKGLNGNYSVNDEVLKKIVEKSNFYKSNFYSSWMASGDICREVLKLREVDKQLKTYFIGYGELALPRSGNRSTIHHKLNHTKTATGRLSSSEPNMQNTSK